MIASERPLATILTVNYNSMRKIDVILSCVKATVSLKWRPLEIVFVDNGSTDGSFERVEEYAKSIAPSDLTLKFIFNESNLGFAKANNRGFSEASPSSSYAVVLNNDMAPDPDSLNYLIDFLEREANIAGAQPVVWRWDGRFIDSAGGVISSWGASAIGHGLDKLDTQMPFYVSHIYGAYSVYKKEAVLRSGGLFLSNFFMYGDDYELGVRLQANGYKLATVPINGGRHYVSATVSSTPVTYYAISSETASIVMYSGVGSNSVLLRILGVLLYSIPKRRRDITRGLIDGIFLGIKLRSTLPRKMKNALFLVPVPRTSIADWFFMHTRFNYLAQRRVANSMVKKYAIVA